MNFNDEGRYLVSSRPIALVLMNEATFRLQFPQPELDRLSSLVDVLDAETGEPIWFDSLDSPHALSRLAQAEVVVSSWGAPQLTNEHLDAAPALRAVLHCAGSVRWLLPDDVHTRELAVITAADLNAVPVAEYTLAAVIMAGKRALPLAQLERTDPSGWGESFARTGVSNLGRTIGIVGFSKIGRRVIELLKVLETGPILVSDPFADPAEVAACGATLVSLEDVLRSSEILSLHAPLLPSTHHMIGADQLALLPDGATIINTARGAILDHEALLAECSTGRLDAILDVTDPEPLPVGHPLLALPNVTITPHIAGSLGTETLRLSRHVLDQLERWTTGQPLEGTLPLDGHEVSA